MVKKTNSKTAPASNANVVTVTRKVRPDSKSQEQFTLETAYDFSGCTPEDIRNLAVRACVIDTQRKFRALAKQGKADPKQFARVDVKTQIVDAPRAKGTTDPLARIRALAAKHGLTPEQVAAAM